jgi:hypothetical protein
MDARTLLRSEGTSNAMPTASTTAAMTMSAVVAMPLSWSVLRESSRSTSEIVKTRRNSAIWTTNSEMESISPADSAVAAARRNAGRSGW